MNNPLIKYVMDNDMVELQQDLERGESETHIRQALIVSIQERKVPFVAHLLPHLQTL